MARECPAKGKGEKGRKVEGKGVTKGGMKRGGEKEDSKEEALRPRESVRKGPRGSEMSRKSDWLPGAVLHTREDRSQVSGVQCPRGWRRGAASGCGRDDHGGGALDCG